MICPNRLKQKGSCSGNRFSDERILRIVEEAERTRETTKSIRVLRRLTLAKFIRRESPSCAQLFHKLQGAAGKAYCECMTWEAGGWSCLRSGSERPKSRRVNQLTSAAAIALVPAPIASDREPG